MAYYPFNEGTGDVSKDSTGNNDDAYIFATWTSEAVSGNALSFSGDGEYVDLPPAALPAEGAYSVSMWFNPASTLDNTTERAHFLLKFGSNNSDDDIDLYIEGTGTPPVSPGKVTDGALGFQMYGDGWNVLESTTTSWEQGTWYHVVATFDPSAGMELFINGVSEGVNAEAVRGTTPPTEFYLGHHYHNMTWDWEGSIDEVKFFDYAISESEALSLYEEFEPSAVFTPSKAGYTLGNNYPNPFSSSTTISYSLEKQERVRMDVYGITGRLVKTLVNETQPAGQYQVTWYIRNSPSQQISSGVYFYRMSVGDYSETKKMLIK
jgi:hypothetical protein